MNETGRTQRDRTGRMGRALTHLCASAALIALAACGALGNASTNDSSAAATAALGPAPAIKDLNGLAPAQVTALLGDPDLRRRDPPAEIWQYRSADCVLDLFFYEDNGKERVVYTESRAREAQRGPHAPRCVDEAAPIKSRTPANQAIARAKL